MSMWQGVCQLSRLLDSSNQESLLWTHCTDSLAAYVNQEQSENRLHILSQGLLRMNSCVNERYLQGKNRALLYYTNTPALHESYVHSKYGVYCLLPSSACSHVLHHQDATAETFHHTTSCLTGRRDTMTGVVSSHSLLSFQIGFLFSTKARKPSVMFSPPSICG